MEYSTATTGVAGGGSTTAGVFDGRSLWCQLATLSDQRHRRGRRYALPLLLLLVVLAKLSGEDRLSGIADWVKHRRARLAQAMGLELARAPHHNTYRRVLANAVTPEQLDQVVQAFQAELSQAGHSVLISIDGKTLKGTIDAEDRQGTHLLVAYLCEEGIVLQQVPTGHKSNEIGAARTLLEGVDLHGKIVAADAMHTQRALSAQVVAAGGNYILPAKDNQPTLRADIEQLFSGNDGTVEGGRIRHDFQTAQQTTKGHGRREKRQITVSSELKGYSDWPGLEQVFRLERQRTNSRTGKHEGETVYGLTSLRSRDASPAQLLALTRTYWGVENGLHYCRDVTFHEDATRLTQGNAGHVMASLNNMVIGLLRLAGHTNLAAARRFCAADLANVFAMLGHLPRL